MARAGRAAQVALATMVGGVLGASCVIDSDNLCGPHQVIWGDDEACVCDAQSAYTADGCVPCGEHEIPGPGGCVCEAGYLRETPSSPCAESTSTIGTPCQADADCPDQDFPHCQISSAGDGYCTSTGCTNADDCGAGYACDAAASPSYCQRPPSGVGTPCETEADCAAFEANYCENVVSHTCLVINCTVSPNSCFPGTECCPVPGFPNLCLAEGLCVAP